MMSSTLKPVKQRLPDVSGGRDAIAHVTDMPDASPEVEADRPSNARFEPLAAQVLERAERLEWGEHVDGVAPASLTSFEDALAAAWHGWTVAARDDVTVRHRGRAQASSLVAIILLRHDRTGVWVVGEVTLTYWSQPGVVHISWETMSLGGRMHAVVSHLLNKSEDAATLPALVQRLAEQIERLAGGGAPETQRRARCARLLLSLDEDAATAAVGSRCGDEVAQAVGHEIASMRTLAGLGGLGQIHHMLEWADADGHVVL
jgi:hypothetical protein